MGFTLGDVLKNVNLNEEELAPDNPHRTETRVKRPDSLYELKAIWRDTPEMKKTEADPTPDLVTVPAGSTNLPDASHVGYLIFDKSTFVTYYAPTDICLNKNFIYRDDLDILELSSVTDEEVTNWMAERTAQVNPGVNPRYTCYILDNPANESYEVYYETNYPARVYGQSTPTGCFVHKYKNRFHRDMAIMELDELYSSTSKKGATKFVKREYKQNECVIISDGAWMRDVCSSAIVYIDCESLITMTEGKLPSEADQAVLISELRAATNALQLAKAKGKKIITYYYDNTSILNCFRNRKTEYIEEVKAYKDLLEELDKLGYQVTFREVHPKSGEDRSDDNQAILFFHNRCDAECRTMSEMFRRDYASYAAAGNNSDSKTFKQVKEEFKPKGKPGQSSGKGNYSGYNNNNRNNNVYGRRGGH